MANPKLSDREAKEILKLWPTSTKGLWPPPNGVGAWVRAQPADGKQGGPRLYSPGASEFGTQPDGMWAIFDGVECCDLVVIEVCGTVQNLNDKRSRYMPSTNSLVLRVTKAWAEEEVRTPGRGGGQATRRSLSGTMPAIDDEVVNVPVRALRALYALPNGVYKKWAPHHTPTGYEYFIPHSSLGTYTRPETQAFLKSMSVASHFHTLPKNVVVPQT